MTEFSAALAHAQRGEFAEAEQILQALIKRERKNADALHLLGNILHAQGKSAAALEPFARAAQLAPNNAALAFNQAVALAAAQHDAEAIAAFDRALKQKPNDLEALRGQSASLARLARHEEALTACDRALALNATEPGVHFLRGAALIALDRADDAIAALDVALAANPNHTAARAHRATAAANLGRFTEALGDIDAVIAREPARLDHLKRRAHVLSMAGRRSEARAAYDAILAQTPNDAEARYGRADALLALGDLKAGWEDYEARAQTLYVPPSSAPIWTGAEPLNGKTILIQAEQGFGDLFQFCRFFPELKRRGARVILQERPQTFALLQSLGAIDQFVALKDPAPLSDYRISTNSLMRALNVTLETIPANIPYLHADPEAVAHWREKLAPSSWTAGVSPAGAGVSRRDANAPYRIGLCWSGTMGSAFQRSRRLDQAALARLCAIDAQIISLQFDPTPQDSALLAPHNIPDHSADTRDFADLAALIANLDLVISVDTNVAHLAGALGKPLYVLLPCTADWRWLEAREDSPWYPHAKLFRQTAHGDWSTVIDRVLAAL